MDSAGKLISKLNLPHDCVAPGDVAKAAWPRTVGKRIAGHARAVALKGGCLIVEVEDMVWQKQLESLRMQIISRLNETLGASVVTHIDFRIAVPRRMPQKAVTAKPVDEADTIQDASLRLVYKISRKRSTA